MRPVQMIVGNRPGREMHTFAYPKGQHLGFFLVPTYQMSVSGTDARGSLSKKVFEVLRFGVQSNDGKSARVVGLKDNQTHIIKSWIPSYTVHSARSNEIGAWQVYKNFLIHDGPDDESDDIFASIGCIEVMGHNGFNELNDYIIELVGAPARTRAEQLSQIGNSRMLTITYMKANPPPLKRTR